MACYLSCSDKEMERWRQLRGRNRRYIISILGYTVMLINKSARFVSSVTQLVVPKAFRMALTQCGWAPAVSRPARGKRDVVALRWGHNQEIYWWRGSVFWQATSVRMAGQTKQLSSRTAFTINTFLSCYWRSNMLVYCTKRVDFSVSVYIVSQAVFVAAIYKFHKMKSSLCHWVLIIIPQHPVSHSISHQKFGNTNKTKITFSAFIFHNLR